MFFRRKYAEKRILQEIREKKCVIITPKKNGWPRLTSLDADLISTAIDYQLGQYVPFIFLELPNKDISFACCGLNVQEVWAEYKRMYFELVQDRVSSSLDAFLKMKSSVEKDFEVKLP